MKKKLLAGLVTGMFIFTFVEISNATLITYEFSGNGNRIFEHDGQTGVNTTVNNSSLFGLNITSNSEFSALFTYDTLAIESSYRENHPEDNAALFASGLINYEVSFGSTSYTFEPYGYVQIWDDRSSGGSTTDSFSISSSQFESSDLFISSGFYIFDNTGQGISGFSIPGSLEQISSLGSESFHFAWLDRNNGDQLHFYGDVTQLTPVEPVPEPSTLLLLGTGLIGFIGKKIRRKNNENGY